LLYSKHLESVVIFREPELKYQMMTDLSLDLPQVRPHLSRKNNINVENFYLLAKTYSLDLSLAFPHPCDIYNK
jgi:hypothetical protein